MLYMPIILLWQVILIQKNIRLLLRVFLGSIFGSSIKIRKGSGRHFELFMRKLAPYDLK